MAFFAAARFLAAALVAVLLFTLAAVARPVLLLFAFALLVRALLAFAFAATARLALLLLDERDDDALRLVDAHFTRVRLLLLRADLARIAFVQRTGTGFGRVQPT